MGQVTDGEPLTQPLVKHRQTHDSPWLWLALIAGSIATHLLLAIVVLPVTSRLSTASQQSAYTAINLVELPYTETSKTAAKPPGASQPTTQRAAARSPVKQAAPLSHAAAGEPIGLAPTFKAAPANRPSPASPPTMPSLPVLPPVARPSAGPSSSPVAPAAPASPAAPSAPDPDPDPADAATPSIAPSAPPSPRIATEPITVPVPQVSESLPVPAASPLPQVVVNANVTPPQLTANLKFDHLPPTEVGVLPETLAAPKNGVNQQTFANSTSSVCLQLVTPEADEFLGKTVALQVATNVKGQVTSTRVRQSSQNTAYDKLAQCIVTHWEFEPARIKNLPVPSNALLVQVTLEQN